MSEGKKNIEQITGLRGIIAFLIAYLLHWALLFYALPDFENPVVATVFGKICAIVVYAPNVFFIMSGYLIHKLYKKKLGDGVLSFGDFMIPKIKRLYPMVIVTALITWILQNIGWILYGAYPLYADGGEQRNSVLALILSFCGLQSGYISDGDTMSVNGPAWFVAVLFLCYMIYYVITAFVRTKWMRNLIYGLLILLGVYLLIDAPNFPLLYVINGRGYLSFFIGVLMQEGIELIENADWEEKSKQMIMTILYIMMLIVFAYSFYECCIHSSEVPFENLILALLFWPSMVYLVIHGYIFSRILSFKGFVLLGKMAMPLFLCNFPTDVAIRMCDLCFDWNLDYANPWIWFLHIVISMIIVVIFHFLFEVPWKKRN